MSSTRQLSFAAGELAPSLRARVDLVKYATGLATCRNTMTRPQGGTLNRPGTKLICEVKDSTTQVRLIEFIFNNEQTYVLEFGSQYMRVIKDGVRVTVDPDDWDIGTAYEVGDLVAHSGVNYYCVQANTGNAPPNGTYWYALVDDIFEMPTPFAVADLMALRFVQSADVIFFAHRSYAPQELRRYSDTKWTMQPVAFGSALTPPNVVTGSTSPPFASGWRVTAVDASGDESLPDGAFHAIPTSGAPITIAWSAVTGAVKYRIYRSDNLDTGSLSGPQGPYGFVGESTGLFFVDNGILPDYLDTPPSDPGLFATEGDYPGAVTLSGQSLYFGGTDNDPQRIWKSRTGVLRNFNLKIPVTDDSPVVFTLVGRRVNDVKHLLELRRLLALTSGAEWAINGDAAGIISPTQINAKAQSYNGCGDVSPVNVDGTVIFIHARASVVRDLGFSFDSDLYDGSDLGIFSEHLLAKKAILDVAYQAVPHCVVWMVRSDGQLIGMTFVKKHEVNGWHRHDTDGLFERVCVVPEGQEDVLYVVVKRTIAGVTKRYIERMHSRAFTDVKDVVLLDCSVSYDGRNTDEDLTVTLSGGTEWKATETLTLTASAALFESSDVGKQFHLYDEDGLPILKFTVRAFTSSTVVTGRADRTVVAAAREVAFSAWARAINTMDGLDHLEGEAVGILGDGFVVASPNNAKHVRKSVATGSVSLNSHYAVVHAGLPVTADVELLDIDTQARKVLVSQVKVHIDSSRGGFFGGSAPAGDGTAGLVELMPDAQTNRDLPPPLVSDKRETNIEPTWKSNGRIFIRQVDPLPLSILAVVPSGLL